jgi:outer membrane protein
VLALHKYSKTQMRQLTYFILLLSLPTALSAQTVYSLKESIAFSLEHHPSLGIYQNQVEIANQKAKQSLSGYLPQVTSSATIIDNLNLQKTIIPAGVFGPEATVVQFGTQFNTQAVVDINQTIFDMSKMQGIKASKPYAELNELQKEQNKEAIIYNTSVAYFQVLIMREQLKNLEINKAKSVELLEILKNQLKNGLILEKDLDRIKVSLNSTNYQIEDAKVKEKMALNNLKNSMGISIENIIDINVDIDFSKYILKSLNDNLSVHQLVENKISETNYMLQKISLKSIQSSFLPTVSAVAKIGTQALNNSFSTAFSNWNNFSYVGVSINLPLSTGFKRYSQMKEQQLVLNNAKRNDEINKENLKLKFENAKTSISTAYSNYLSSKENMDLARKIGEVSEFQYGKGTANLSDYLNDDTAYKNAQSNYLSSIYNLMISNLNYQKSQGTITSYISELN